MKNKVLSVCLFVFLFSIIFLLLGCPPVDKPPKLTIPDKTVDEGQVLQFDLKQYAEDKDKNTLVFTIVSGVGEIVESDYRYAPTFDESGEKEVKIRVTNAKGKSAEDTFKITVNDVNRPPVLDIPDQTIDEGETLILDLNDYADDPDGDDLTFTLVSGVGEITDATYTYTTDYDVLKKVREYNPAAESVDFEVSISANDGKGGEATTTFTIRVTDVNRPPALDIPNQTIDEGETLTLNLLDYTTDPDTLDTFTYTLIFGVGNIAGSTYTYTATYTDAGTKTVTVRVTDNKGGTSECEFNIEVIEAGNPPEADFRVIESSPTEGRKVHFDASDSSDEEDSTDELIIRWDFNGDGTWEIDFSANKRASEVVSHVYSLAGSITVVVEVKDSQGLISRKEKQIQINLAPPQSLYLESFSDNEITIVWNDMSTSEDSYRVSLNDNPLAQLPANTENHTFELDKSATQTISVYCTKGAMESNKTELVIGMNLSESTTVFEEVSITLPASHVGGEVRIEVSQQTQELPEGCNPLSSIYDIDIELSDDATFFPIKLAFDPSYEPSNGSDMIQLILHFDSDSGIWVPMMTSIGEDSNLVTYTSSFSEFVAAEVPANSAILNVKIVDFDAASRGLTFSNSALKIVDADNKMAPYSYSAEEIQEVEGGFCYGMSVVSAATYINNLPRDPYFEFVDNDDLLGYLIISRDGKPLLSDRILQELNHLTSCSSIIGLITGEHVAQLLALIEMAFPGILVDLDPTIQTMSNFVQVTEAITALSTVKLPVVVVLRKPNIKDSGHALVAYGFNLASNGVDFLVYDPNYPFEEKVLSVRQSHIKSEYGEDYAWFFTQSGVIFAKSVLLEDALEDMIEKAYAPRFKGLYYTPEDGIIHLSLWNHNRPDNHNTPLLEVLKKENGGSYGTLRSYMNLDTTQTFVDEDVSQLNTYTYKLSRSDGKTSDEYSIFTRDMTIVPSDGSFISPDATLTINVTDFLGLNNIRAYDISECPYVQIGRKRENGNIELGADFLKNRFGRHDSLQLMIVGDCEDGFIVREVAYFPSDNDSPTVTKVSGPNGDVSESTSTFSWTGNAPGGTITKYEYRKDGGSWVNHGLNTSYTWSGYSEGPHKFEVRAQDNDSLYSNTITWDFQYTAPGPEKPPVVPFDPHPEDNSQSQPMSLTLVWDCYDPNGDPVTYDVYFEKQMNTSHKVPTKKIGTEIPEKSFAVGPLLETTTYLWQIVAYDSKGNKTTGPVWKFKTGRKPNNPPEEPSDPSPANNSTKQTIRPTLRWKCTDPDGDGIDYELYFGTTTNPPKVLDKPDDGNSYYEMKKSLEYDTQYYWKVVATDRPEYGESASSAGPLWTFRTAKKGEPGTVEWEVQFSNEGYIWGEIAILSNGTRIVPGGQNDPRLYAFTPSGSLLWTYDAESFITAGPVLSIEDSIYIGTVDGTIHSIESNGEVRWKYKAPEQITKALPALGPDGTVYFAVGAFRTLEKGLYALHPNGEIKWIFTSDGWITSGISIGPDGTIYFGCADWFLYAVNQDGTIRWKYETGEYVRGTPAIGDDGTIYFGSQDGYLYAITANSKLIWRYKTYNGYPDICDPVIDKNGNIYIRASEYFHCVGPDGKKKWVYTFDFTTCENIAIGDDGIIYIANKFAGQITAFNSKGNVLWYLNLPPVDTSPTISDGIMNIATVDGVLHAINVSSYSLADSSWPKFGRDLRNTGCMIEPYPNNPPDTPRNPTPEHNSPEQPLSITLGWECSDPDYDFLKYDVFFGKQPNPMTKVSGDIKDNECQIDNLEPETTYYWKVNAKDGRDGVTSSPVWSFTTKSGNDVTTYFYEGFETGDLLSNQWVVSGDYLPAVQSQEVFDGNYALSFLPPFASEDQIVTSSIEITVTLPTDAFISFYRKVSGRGGDWLDFYIDSNLVGQWSALEDPEFYSGMQELEWGEVVRRIPAGTHTLEWTYTALRKTLTESSDNSWIDEIRIVDIMDLGDVVLFPDSRLDTFVRAAIGKQNAEEIRSREVQDISIIVIVNDQPLEGLSARREIDLVPREVIERMEGISLTESNIPVDFSGIEYLKALIVLAVIDNAVEDITPLKNCEKLFAIIFSSPYITPALNISDISPISSLKNLRMLLLQSGSVDLSGLKNSSSLVTLLLDSLQIENVGTISDLKQLIYLSIVDCGIQDVQFIEGLVDLIVLLLSSNQISDISQLAELVKLEELYLNRNNITDISALVANNGLDSGDLVDLRYNELDLDLSSDNMSNIQTLLDRGVEVLYLPQNTNLPPTVTKLSGPNGDVSESTSAFSWTGNAPDGEVVKYEYRKDEGNWIDHGLNTSYTWSGYAEGPHKFEVRAQDNKGEYSEPAEWTFTYSTGAVVVGEMVLVEGGTFMMGDEFGDLWDGCRPVHQVTLTYDFWLGKYEVTFDEYDAFCNATGRSKPGDSGWGRGQRPVIWVSWWDAIAYCNWLSEKNGLPKAYDNSGNLLDASGKVTTDITKVLGYRLPTEAEWEYAARGGKHRSPYKYSGSDNVDIVAWYSYNSGGRTHEVGQKLPNALGIYDMSGNVWEWCSDWWYYYTETPKTNPYNSTAGSDRVARGGGCYNDATYSRVANRRDGSPTYTLYSLGFRICRTVP